GSAQGAIPPALWMPTMPALLSSRPDALQSSVSIEMSAPAVERGFARARSGACSMLRICVKALLRPALLALGLCFAGNAAAGPAVSTFKLTNGMEGIGI